MLFESSTASVGAFIEWDFEEPKLGFSASALSEGADESGMTAEFSETCEDAGNLIDGVCSESVVEKERDWSTEQDGVEFAVQPGTAASAEEIELHSAE